MSKDLVNITLTKLGFQRVANPRGFSLLERPNFEMSPQNRLKLQNSLLGGSGAPIVSKPTKHKSSKLDTFLRESPTLHKYYKKLKPTVTKLAPFAKAIMDKKVTIPFKNDKSKSWTLGHVGNYKNYAAGERDTLKRLGVKVGPQNTPLYGIKFTKRF